MKQIVVPLLFLSLVIEAKASDGQSLYLENCASCHGENLEGEPNWRTQKDDGTLPAPPHDETGHTWHHGDRLLFEYTKLGGAQAMAARGLTGFKSGMPAFEDVLTDEDIHSILDYIRSTWPEDIQATQAARTKAEPPARN